MVTCILALAPAVPASALPIGMEQEDGSTQLIPVEPSELPQNPVLNLLRLASLCSVCIVASHLYMGIEDVPVCVSE